MKARTSRFVVLGACAASTTVLLGCGQADDAADNGDKDDTTTVRSEYRVTASAPWVERHALTIDQLNSELGAWQTGGYRPTYINGYAYNGADYYNAIWQKDSTMDPGWSAKAAMPLSTYETLNATFAKAFMYPVVVSGYTVNGGDYFAAIWEKATAGTIVEMHELTNTTLPQQLSAHASGYRVIHISGYGGSSGDKYAVIWQKVGFGAPKQVVKADTSEAAYQTTFNTETAAGYHLTMLTEYPMSSGIHVVSAYSQGTVVPQMPLRDLPADVYSQSAIDLRYQGYRPITVSGFSAGGTLQFSALWQNYAMSQTDLNTIDNAITASMNGGMAPAMSMAVVNGGRLVFAKAYGFADTSTFAPATTSSIFRIASVSKSITATAILELVEKGLISLDGHVFGPSSVFGNTYPYPACVAGSPCLEHITIRHLLGHLGGGWSQDYSDPNPPAPASKDPIFLGIADTCDQAVTWALQNVPLAYEPGTHYGYSSFGYCVLGRIIEKVTGNTPYDVWVQQNVLDPASVFDMQIGRNDSKLPNEVTYYNPGGTTDANTDPNLTLMNANGGWVGSPLDLLRFLNRVDSIAPPAGIPPLIVQPSNQTAMITDQLNYLLGGQNSSGYGLGWMLGDDPVTKDPACSRTPTHSCGQFHNGSILGTASQIYASPGGISWAVIANVQPMDLYDAMLTIVNGVTWPDAKFPGYDLFNPPNLAIYDPPTPGGPKTQCTVGNATTGMVTMHCCPTGYVMIGVDAGKDVFKCAPVQTVGALSLDKDPGTQRWNMHACPAGSVMVGVSVPLNDLACMALPPGSITERIDYRTADTYPVRVCDLAPSSAMSGIRVDKNLLLCASDPHLD